MNLDAELLAVAGLLVIVYVELRLAVRSAFRNFKADRHLQIGP